MSHPILIGIAGPSGAGKSSFCRHIQASIPQTTRLKLDDFFKDITEVPKLDQWTNWDHPDSLHWDELIQAARDLKAGHYAIVPNYYRKEDRRIGEKCVFSSPVILVDGFMSLYHPELRALLDFSLFFDLSEESQIRRRKERQPWVEDGYLSHIMLPAARTYILPTKAYASVVINAEPSEEEVAKQGLVLIQEALAAV